MKIALVLSVVVMATPEKILPAVLQSLEQTSTISVAVSITEPNSTTLADLINAQKGSTQTTNAFDWAKCNDLTSESVFLCDDMTKEEIDSLAALPDVQEITTVADTSTPCPSKITPKPSTAGADRTTNAADTTTTAADPTITGTDPTITGTDPTITGTDPTTTGTDPITTTPCPSNITPKPSTAGADPATNAADTTTTAVDSTTSAADTTTTAAGPTTNAADPTNTTAAATLSMCENPVDDVDYYGNDIDSTRRSNSNDSDPTTTAADPTNTTAAATLSMCENPVDDVDYYGNDIDSTRRSNSNDCCDDCVNTPNCVVYVWTPWEGGTCFLKRIVGAPSHYKDAKAAKLTQPSV
ncbi:hypothetical protein H257_18760 [Aphanomyces astaci]|uniref:Apple domain-containing protein n=1 Tax=Aphanomyces astaci TaxID=112090 RepID=W4FBP1_APHAT|nr:hypothetical protein H257_18760 [Aphanomyces astaci]ETV64334.1 hypothetical protein H257_18760 [Aphanomyces astaci]|eukprot:XP_009846183.1 hypothetical protein H257_18760 [Aphanomyces astaci]